MSGKQKFTFLMLLLGLLSAFGPFVTDLYLPALPSLADYFAASPRPAERQVRAQKVVASLSVAFCLWDSRLHCRAEHRNR